MPPINSAHRNSRAMARLRAIVALPGHAQMANSIRRTAEGRRDGLTRDLSDAALARAHGARWAAPHTLDEIGKADR